jgi:gliding motility-associated-like protein
LIANKSIEYQARIFDRWRCPLLEVFKIEVIRNEVVIPNVFTPNGDNVNDYFEIRGLVPGSSLKIYDEEGRLIFSAENYDGRWNGFDSQGRKLPEGTYWYVLEIQDSDPFKGWVYLKE